MRNDLPEPSENDSIECHLQAVGMGTLVCRAARQTGERTTNEVSPAMCFSCPAGTIFREVGCDAILPKLRIDRYMGGARLDVEGLFCQIRKRSTTADYCMSCGLASAETTRRMVTTARSLFEAQGFHAAYQDLEKAREAIRDGDFANAVTRSISCLESCLRSCHEKLGEPLPESLSLVTLWKSAREKLKMEDLDPTGSLTPLLNALYGVSTHLGGVRNSLGDAHGKGLLPPTVSESLAELALNTASTLSTFIIRRMTQLTPGASDE